MAYFDGTDTVYNIMDSTHLKPLKDEAIYFLVDQKNVTCLNDEFFINYLRHDSFSQKEIENKYPSLNVIFYKKSENTDHLVKTRLAKYLPFCNDDIIAEYEWKYGIPSSVFHYENGAIKDAQNMPIK